MEERPPLGCSAIDAAPVFPLAPRRVTACAETQAAPDSPLLPSGTRFARACPRPHQGNRRRLRYSPPPSIAFMWPPRFKYPRDSVPCTRMDHTSRRTQVFYVDRAPTCRVFHALGWLRSPRLGARSGPAHPPSAFARKRSSTFPATGLVLGTAVRSHMSRPFYPLRRHSGRAAGCGPLQRPRSCGDAAADLRRRPGRIRGSAPTLRPP